MTETRRVPTIKDVAHLAGVSIGTVSGVVHGKPTIRPLIRDRVKKAIEELGYSPNSVAQSMRLGSTRTVGIIVPHINAPYLATMVSAAQDVFHAAGYATLLGVYTGRPDRENEQIDVLMRRKVDGLLISLSSEDDRALDQKLRDVNVPIVLLDRERPTWADSVVVDHASAMRRATEYLIQLGHRRIAAILGGRSIHASRARLDGYASGHRAANLPIDPRLLGGDEFLPDYGYQQTRAMCAMKDPPTAILAGGLPLPGILRALRDLALQIPSDISVISTSDSDLAELMSPPLTCERWNAQHVGDHAARLALKRIQGGKDEPQRQVVVATELVMRQSCAPPVTPRGSRKRQAKF